MCLLSCFVGIELCPVAFARAIAVDKDNLRIGRVQRY